MWREATLIVERLKNICIIIINREPSEAFALDPDFFLRGSGKTNVFYELWSQTLQKSEKARSNWPLKLPENFHVGRSYANDLDRYTRLRSFGLV